MRIIKEIMTKCILANTNTSEALRNTLNGNSNPNIKNVITGVKEKLTQQDLEIISDCRKEAAKDIRERLGKI